MIYQNDSALSERMNKWGCFIRSSILIAELKTGRWLGAKEINLIEENAIKFGYVNKNYDLLENKSAPIIQLAFDMLGNPKKVIEIGKIENNEKKYKDNIREEDKRIDGIIEKINQNGPSKTHFRVWENGNMYDPHSPEIKNLGNIYFRLYHIKDFEV